MATPRYSSVDHYLESLDNPIKAHTLRAIINTILASAPGLEAKIAWNVPHIHKNGKYVAGVCAYKDHLTYSPSSNAVLDAFKDRLAPFTVLKHTFHLPIDWKVDKQLITDMTLAKLAELD